LSAEGLAATYPFFADYTLAPGHVCGVGGKFTRRQRNSLVAEA